MIDSCATYDIRGDFFLRKTAPPRYFFWPPSPPNRRALSIRYQFATSGRCRYKNIFGVRISVTRRRQIISRLKRCQNENTTRRLTSHVFSTKRQNSVRASQPATGNIIITYDVKPYITLMTYKPKYIYEILFFTYAFVLYTLRHVK